jgi:PPOX class probable F420-dependent enzyme
MSVQLPDELLQALLNRWPVGRLATVSTQGMPHSVPIVFCELGGAIYSPVDGKRKLGRNLQRFSNIAQNPKATLLLDEYAMDWQRLWWVRIDGIAERYKPDAGHGRAIADRLMDKYPQYNEPDFMFDTTVFLRLRPDKVAAWTQSNSLATIGLALAETSQE